MRCIVEKNEINNEKNQVSDVMVIHLARLPLNHPVS